MVTGLIPSIGLSAASWYIKKRLLKKALDNRPGTDQPNCGATNNIRHDDEDVEDNQRQFIYV